MRTDLTISDNEILQALADWNDWNRPEPETVPRPFYENRLRALSATGEIVVLQGVRRCGKSTILRNAVRVLLAEGVPQSDILFLNLEDPRFMGDLTPALLTRIRELHQRHFRPAGPPHIFLDEVQNIPGFDKWLLTEYELHRSRLYVTGSNAHLLGREIGTVLSGRYLPLTVHPLSFAEFLSFRGMTVSTPLELVRQRVEIAGAFDDYLAWGAFPRVARIADAEVKKLELRAYFDSILLRDVAARHRLDSVEALLNLSGYLLANTATILSLNSLKGSFGSSYHLLNSYVEYLEGAFLVNRLPLFDWSLKRRAANPKKIHAVDTGLAAVARGFSRRDSGKLLETVVVNELLRRGGELYYGKTGKGLEVDCIALQDGRIRQLIQVCQDMSDPRTRNREIRALCRAAVDIPYARDAQLLILSHGPAEVIRHDGLEIQVVNVIEWLLGQVLGVRS
ncbi:MAG: ATP-binding protein [Syntrophobacterales bacterium]|nr:ATP-binding protein [Syntrophobacterales bacterium]